MRTKNGVKFLMPSADTMADMRQRTEAAKKFIAEYEASNKQAYWNAPTRCIKAQAEFGAENIFFVNERYHSYIDDDYAYFSYFNQATGEEFDDVWTTAGACPHYDHYKCITIDSAFKKGLLDEDKYVEWFKKKSMKSLEEFKLPFMGVGEWVEHRLLLKVEGSRKWQGEGYAVSTKSLKYGYHTTVYVSVCDPETKTIYEVDKKWCTPVFTSEMEQEYKAWATEIIDGIDVNDLKMVHHDQFAVDVAFSIYDWFKTKAVEAEKVISKSTNPSQEERDRKKAEFKKKKMEALVEWVKTNTDKKGDAILELAEHIFAKRYA